MSVMLRRISTTPATPFQIMVDGPPAADGTPGELAAGGQFVFAPAGEPGDAHIVSDHVAKVITSDPGHAGHFAIDGAEAPAMKVTRKRSSEESSA